MGSDCQGRECDRFEKVRRHEGTALLVCFPVRGKCYKGDNGNGDQKGYHLLAAVIRDNRLYEIRGPVVKKDDMFRLLTIFLSLCCLGATWNTNEPPEQLKWSLLDGAKWDIQESPYAESQVDQPDPGWYRSPLEYRIPVEWPDFAKSTFLEVGQKELSEKWKAILGWSVDELPANTKWAYGHASKDSGYIEINLSQFSFFAMFRIEPEGTLDQDFKGNAKIYGLDEQRQYRIHAFDALGYLGSLTTAITDKYIRVYDESGADPVFNTDQYSRTHALHVFEDPNGAAWVATQDPLLSGAAYYFPNLTTYDQSGKKRWSYRPLMGYNDPDTWEAGILHNRSDGAVIYATGRVPYLTTGYYYDGAGNVYTAYDLSSPSTGYIAKVAYSGSTVWQFQPAAGAYKIIGNTAGTGYTFVGNYWGAGDYYWYGTLGQVNTSGTTITWGNSSTFVTEDLDDVIAMWWSITKNSEGHYIAAGKKDAWSANRATGGTASTDGACATNPIANAFDGNPATYATYKGCCAFGSVNTHWIQYDFGAGNAYTIERIADETGFAVDASFRSWLIQGSQNGTDWTTIVNQSVDLNNSNFPDSVFENSTAYRYYRITLAIECGDVHENCAGGSCATGGDAWSGEQWYAYNVKMYEAAPYAILSKISGTAGATEGNVLSGVSFPAAEQFYDVCTSRNQDRIAAIGNTPDDSVYVVTVDNSLNTIQARTLAIGSVGRSIRPTEDGGYVICGTYNDSGTDKMFISKLDETLDPEWTKYFIEPGVGGSVGRYAVETEDHGFLAVGGSYPTATSSKVYIVKTNRHGESCSPGTVCD